MFSTGFFHDDYFNVLLAFIFVLLNAFFVAAEFAIVKVRETRLEILVQKGNSLAKMALGIVKNLNAYLSATQLGITLTSLGLGWIGEPAFAHLIHKLLTSLHLTLSEITIHSTAITAAFLLISAFHIIIGELMPKSIAIQMAEKVSMVIALPLKIFYYVFFPFLWILNSTSNLFVSLIGLTPTHGPSHAISEAELKLIFEDSFEEGTISGGKKDLLHKAIDFSHKKVSDIMVSENGMICFYLNDTLTTNLGRAKEYSHTRFPLRENQKGKILGFVHMKDVIWSLENGEIINLYDLARPVLFFPPQFTVEQALKAFQKKKIHMAIVSDSQNQILGLLTLEDVIEELVGEIEDEFDTE
ncbi:MAG: hypothetical protein ACD_73C00488G0002 [uncultured bacterium]|nr:MAG: hypothetical protein ACD_73C00488G0002 [uncultured bacterium]